MEIREDRSEATRDARLGHSLSDQFDLHLGVHFVVTQRADIVDDVPPLVSRHRAAERWHRSSIKPSDQVAEHVPIRFSALETGPAGEIERRNRIALAVGQGCSRRSIPSPIFAMARPAIHALEELSASLDAFGTGWRFWRNVDGLAGFFLLKG